MIASEAVSRIQRKLGYRNDKSDEILDELNDAQATLERGVPAPGGQGTFIPWFMTTEAATALTVANEERLLLPSDFVRELENALLYRFNPDADSDTDAWIPLVKNDPAFLKAKYADTDAGVGKPEAYWLSGGYVRFAPIPDDEYIIKMIYGGRDTTLTLSPDITNKWLTNAPWLLIGAAGTSLGQSLRDASAVTFFQQRMAADVLILYQETLAHEITNDRPVMGGEN
jgi:hypothetical protein